MSGEQFLKQTMTVIGSRTAISEKNEDFLKKHATAVGSYSAIEEVCGETGATGTVFDPGHPAEPEPVVVGATSSAEPEVGETGVGE